MPPTRYVVTLFRDHRVEFRGDGAQGDECRASERLLPERAAEVDSALTELMRFANEYDGYDRTDAAKYLLTYSRVSGETKTIHHYRGDQSKDSVELAGIEDRMVALLGVDGWTKYRYPSRDVMLDCLVKQLSSRAAH